MDPQAGPVQYWLLETQTAVEEAMSAEEREAGAVVRQTSPKKEAGAVAMAAVC